MENWSIVMRTAGPALQGRAYNHPDPKHFDGEKLKSSPIDFAEGTQVRCRKRTWVVGTVDPDFLPTLAEHGITFDPDNPAAAINAIVEKLCPGPPKLN